MAALRIVIIGGGSYMWSPKIIQDLALTNSLSGSTIVLEDTDAEAVEVLLIVGKRIIEQAGANLKIEATTNQKQALKGADYVILTISTGGLEAMRHDLKIPEKYGIYQTVGDTVGPGGISRSLRNIPVVVDICKDMEKLCPNAWMINYTNPMSTLTRAMAKTSKIKTIGLCHELYGVMHTLQKIFKLKDRSQMEIRIGGVNHCSWITSLKIGNNDGFTHLNKILSDPERYADLAKDKTFDSLSDRNLVKFELFKIFGCLPAASDRHTCEFFPFFLSKEAGYGKKYGVKLTTIEERYHWLTFHKKLAKDIGSGKAPIDKSKEAVSNIIAALEQKKDYVDVMNLPNTGQISNLPKDVVVETLAVAGPNGITPMAQGELPQGILNSTLTHVINQEMTVEAGLTGNRKLALAAFMNDPQCVRNAYDGEKMVNELLRANSKYLPQF